MTSENVTLSMLMEKIEALENRIKLLESNEVKSHKPSTSIVASFYTPQIHFIDWVKSLEPTQQHLDIVLSQGYIQGVSVILCELIEQSTEPPILVSGTKKNQVYIYETSKWSIIDNKQFETFVDVIQSKLLKLFKKWKEDNPKYALEEYSELLSKYHQNILGTKYPKITTLQRIKTSVYTSLL
tara:strand:- start:923 stop:1471 length:549 start_codon:yes stop_codon:yes gene_type:complete